jgi:hypothetical protein
VHNVDKTGVVDDRCLLRVWAGVLLLVIDRSDLILEPANVAFLIHAQSLEELDFLAELCYLRWIPSGGRLTFRRGNVGFGRWNSIGDQMKLELFFVAINLRISYLQFRRQHP